MNRLIVLYVLVLSIPFGRLTAQLRISKVDTLWKIAINNNPNQKVYDLKRQQLGFDFKTSQGFYYPQANIGVNGQDNLILSVTPVPGALVGQAGKTVYLQFGKHYTYNTGLTLTKDLLDWQSMLLSNIARENIALNNAQQASYTQTLKTQLGQYYYAVLVAKASQKIAEKDFNLSDSIYKVIKDKFDNGLTDAIALNQAAINKSNVEQTIAQSKQFYNQAVANIIILTGLPSKTNFEFENEAIENIALFEPNSIGEDKSLLPYKNTMTINNLQRKAQKALYLPKVSATGYLGYQQYQDNLQVDFNKGSWSDYQYIGLGINWSLFTSFANSNKLKSLTVQQQIASENYKAAKEQSNTNDILLLQNYNSYSTMAKSTKNSFDLYGKNVDLSLQKYREGLISIESYFKCYQDYLNAENAYLNNLSNLLTIKASIEARE